MRQHVQAWAVWYGLPSGETNIDVKQKNPIDHVPSFAKGGGIAPEVYYQACCDQDITESARCQLYPTEYLVRVSMNASP